MHPWTLLPCGLLPVDLVRSRLLLQIRRAGRPHWAMRCRLLLHWRCSLQSPHRRGDWKYLSHGSLLSSGDGGPCPLPGVHLWTQLGQCGAEPVFELHSWQLLCLPEPDPAHWIVQCWFLLSSLPNHTQSFHLPVPSWPFLPHGYSRPEDMPCGYISRHIGSVDMQSLRTRLSLQ